MDTRVIEIGQDRRDGMLQFNSEWLQEMYETPYERYIQDEVEPMCVTAIQWCKYWVGLRDEKPQRN